MPSAPAAAYRFARRTAGRAVRTVQRRGFVDRPGKKPTVLLASSGRSGSTWLQDLLAAAGGYRVLFEPFDTHRVTAFAGWENWGYLRPDADGGAFAADADAVFDGRLRHPYVDQDNRVLLPRRRLVKDIRLNPRLAWLARRRSDLKLILLLRNPFAVVRSQLRIDWTHAPERFLNQPELVADHLTPEDAAALAAIGDPFVQRVAFWAIENVVPLRDLRPGDAAVAYYEALTDDPRGEIARLHAALGLGPVGDLDGRIAARSRTTVPKKSGPPPVDGPTDAQLAASRDVLARFGLDRLYDGPGSGLPGLPAGEALSAFARPGG